MKYLLLSFNHTKKRAIFFVWMALLSWQAKVTAQHFLVPQNTHALHIAPEFSFYKNYGQTTTSNGLNLGFTYLGRWTVNIGMLRKDLGLGVTVFDGSSITSTTDFLSSLSYLVLKQQKNSIPVSIGIDAGVGFETIGFERNLSRHKSLISSIGMSVYKNFDLSSKSVLSFGYGVGQEFFSNKIPGAGYQSSGNNTYHKVQTTFKSGVFFISPELQIHKNYTYKTLTGGILLRMGKKRNQ